MSEVSTVSESWVGEGRSAVVYLGHDQQGRPIARKVFTGDTASKLILYLLTGSANPYTWCEDAMVCAVIRRRILTTLTRVWFGVHLKLPRHDGWGWNEHYRAFELRSELINGHHAPLRYPGDTGKFDYFKVLRDKVMKPLQQHLKEAGFDGLVWQAGKGNPVAANNFMLESKSPDGLRWAWIDLESGVPALFAMNPITTIAYYLPKSLQHRRWLFDDVDTNKLQTYILDHHDQIIELSDAEAYAALLQDVTQLEKHQTAWRSLRRYQRNIAYEHSQQRLSNEQVEWYGAHPLRWYVYIIPVTFMRVFAAMGKAVTRMTHWLRTFPYRYTARRSLRYIVSSRYRWGVARWLVARSIRTWLKRGFIEPDVACRLRSELKQDEASGYLTDFSVHIVIKPLVKVTQWGLLPALLVSGVISEVTFAVLLMMGGSIARTLYTSSRLLQSLLIGQRLPWVALLIGLLPMVGNAAYPVQLIHSSTEKAGGLARFIVYDIAATIGRAVPIWGGSDSQVEHFFNRGCDVIVRTLSGSLTRTTE